MYVFKNKNTKKNMEQRLMQKYKMIMSRIIIKCTCVAICAAHNRIVLEPFKLRSHKILLRSIGSNKENVVKAYHSLQIKCIMDLKIQEDH